MSIRRLALLASLTSLAPLTGCLASSSGPDTRDMTDSGDDALTVCAAHGTVEGVDVSEFQGSINWSQVKAAGRVFAFIRVSDGTGHLDSTFAHNWAAAKSAGVIRGAYQFFRASEDGTAQANVLLSHMGTLQAGDLPPVADVEVSDGVGPSTLNAQLAKWVARIKSATGKTPIIYTSPGLWPSLSGSSSFKGETMWVANWGPSCPGLPSPWTSWKFWQYSDSGHVSGIPDTVDLDKFNGTLEDLKAWAGSSGGSSGGKPTGFSDLNGDVAGGLAVARNADGRLEVFGVDASGDVTTTFQTAPNSGWSGWYSLGASNLAGTPTVGTNADGRLEVFARSNDKNLYHAWQDAPNGSIGDWAKMPAYVTSDPVVGRNKDGRLELFVPGTDGFLYHTWQKTPNGGWSDFAAMGNVEGGGLITPAVVTDHAGNLAVVARGKSDEATYIMREKTGGGWTSWTSLGGKATDTPALAVNADGRLEVFVKGTDGALWHKWEATPGGAWSGWSSLGGGVSSPAVAADSNGKLTVFVRGNNNALYRIAQTSSGWTGWTGMGGDFAGAPAPSNDKDKRVEVFVRGTDGSVGHVWEKSDGVW
ncbi:MAG TPA: GH25 family lysozyme [Minicystis sp.]|nr:GH25 family lysozyme [Minicystis sp.]